MKKILIMGCAGAGKSTFAKNLSQLLGLPVIHLDQHYWLPGSVETDKRVFASKVNQLIEDDTWIMDGNYRGTLPLRLARADTVVFLDLRRLKCLWQVFLRTVRFYGNEREDMPDGCPERFDWEFAKYVWDFPRVYRPGLVKSLQDFDGEIVCLKSFPEYRKYLSSITF